MDEQTDNICKAVFMLTRDKIWHFFCDTVYMCVCVVEWAENGVLTT